MSQVDLAQTSAVALQSLNVLNHLSHTVSSNKQFGHIIIDLTSKIYFHGFGQKGGRIDLVLSPKISGTHRGYRYAPTQGHPFKIAIGNCFTQFHKDREI